MSTGFDNTRLILTRLGLGGMVGSEPDGEDSVELKY